MHPRMLSMFVAALSLPFAIPPSAAEEHGSGHHPNAGHYRNYGHDHHEGFRGGDIRRFHEHDIRIWHGGHWYHGPHNGRPGWWWVAGGIWYFYPAPVYPYPNPYLPPLVEAPLPAQYWYYCDDPPGYYPYVAECRTRWQPVPASATPTR